MPYKKYTKRAVDAKQNKAIRKLEKKLQAEVKELITVQASFPITSTGDVIAVTLIGQGDSMSQREGNSVKLQHLTMRHVFEHNISGNINQFVRVILFCDRQQIADTLPAVTDVLESASHLSPYSLASKGRFTILSDKLFRLNANTYNGKAMVMKRKMSQIVRWNSSATTDIQKNGIFILFISSQASSNYPAGNYHTRLCYIDN